MKKKVKEWLPYVAVFVAVLCIKLFIIDVVSVVGCSMYPTFNESNDKVVLERYMKFTSDYERGNVVVIRPTEACKDRLIKRIIGMPGETIKISHGAVYINGELLEEKYISSDIITYPDMEVKIPKDSVFVMGDNRGNSKDSREIGPVKISDISGKVSYRFNLKKWIFNTVA